jgi:hypothetical protein
MVSARDALVALSLSASGRAELAELRCALRQAQQGAGTGGVVAAAAASSASAYTPASRVVAIVGSGEPVEINSHDTVARRLFGERAAMRMFRVAKKKAVILLLLSSGALACVAVPLSTTGQLDVRFALAVWLITTCFIVFTCMTSFLVPVLRMCAARFEFYLLAAHGAAVAACGRAVFTESTVGVLWAFWFCNMTIAMVSFDSLLRRQIAMYAYKLVLGAVLAFLCGFSFNAMQVDEVEITVFGKPVSLNDRVRASLVVLAVFIARNLSTARSSGAYAILRGLRPVKVSRETAELLFAAQSLPARQALAETSEAVATASAAVAPAPPPAPGAPARGVCEAAQAALQEAAGDRAAAGAALLAELDELVGGRERAWARAAEELRAQESSGAAGFSAESCCVRLIVPSYLPVAIDPARSAAAALGGAKLHALCYAVLGTRIFPALALALSPLLMLLFLYELAARDVAPRGFLHAGLALATACGALEALTLNTELLCNVVLPCFNVAWALLNLWLVGVSGALVFDSARDGATWLVLHLLLSAHVIQDAAPSSAGLRRATALAVAASAMAQTAAVFVMWLCVDAGPGAQVAFLGHHINFKQLCFSAQVNSAIIALRAAYRALADVRNLLYLNNLWRVSLPEPELRELHELGLAVQKQAPTPPQQPPQQHAPPPRGDAACAKAGAAEAAQPPPPQQQPDSSASIAAPGLPASRQRAGA